MTDLELPELVRRDASGVSFFTDDRLFEMTGTRVAFTTRHGGTSEGEFAGLNLGIHVDDSEGAVLANRKLALDALGAPSGTKVICPNQVHGSHVCEVFSSDGAEFEAALAEAREGADALVVTCNDVCAMLCYADCAPVILAAPTGAFAVVHAGWRGVAARIAEVALEGLCCLSGANPSEINAYIGPYIHEECFEVGADTYKIFEEGFPDCTDSVCKGGAHVNLGAAIASTLKDCGMVDERIEDLDECTMCNTEDFFSYRASGGLCGRHGAMAFRR